MDGQHLPSQRGAAPRTLAAAELADEQDRDSDRKRLDQLAIFRLRSVGLTLKARQRRRSLQQAAAVASGCTLAPLLPSHRPFPPLFPSLSPPLDVFRSRTLLPPGPQCPPLPSAHIYDTGPGFGEPKHGDPSRGLGIAPMGKAGWRRGAA